MVSSMQRVAWLLLLLPRRHDALVPTLPSVTYRPSLDVSQLGGRSQGHLVTSHRKLGSCKHLSRQTSGRGVSLRASVPAARQGVDDKGVSGTPLSVAMGVGAVTSLIGYLYSKCMKTGFNLLWNIVPSSLFDGSTCRWCDLLSRYPAAYILMIMTLGGSLVAALSTLMFPSLFSAGDYVRVLSRSEDAPSKVDEFPSSRKHLLPVMLLSLLTSISGFSLGPEAPMVTAGGLVGVSLARKYLQSASKNDDSQGSKSVQETLAYAGAAGTLTGFMNIPLAGPIFAMEMVGRDAGISPFAAKSWGAAVAASLAGMVLVRGFLVPSLGVGGHFTYGAKAAVGSLTGGEMILASLGCGVGGAVVGTLFHKTLTLLKSALWPAKLTSAQKGNKKYPAIAKKVLVAATIGLLSMLYPQTMFWGEGSLQCAVDGQCTPFSATPHGIPSVMNQFALVNPNLPFSSGVDALQVGVAKFMAIALASAGGFPGGVIFPLLSNGANLAHALMSTLHPLLPVASSSLVAPLMVMSFMAATLTSITRTPLATVLILAMSASGMTPLSALLPGVLMASYLSVWVSERLSRESFFSYSD